MVVELRLFCCAGLCPPQPVIDWARREGAWVRLRDLAETVAGTECVITVTGVDRRW